MAKKKVKLKEDFEDERKFFNIDQKKLIENLGKANLRGEVKETDIIIFAGRNDKKVKLIKRDTCVEIVHKKSHKEKPGTNERKTKLPLTDINSACNFETQKLIFLKIMELPVLFEGRKRRILYHLTDAISIAVDEWKSGSIKGTRYTEVETNDPNVRIKYIDILKPYLPKNSEVYTTKKGSVALAKDKAKGKDLNTCYTRVKLGKKK